MKTCNTPQIRFVALLVLIALVLIAAGVGIRIAIWDSKDRAEAARRLSKSEIVALRKAVHEGGRMTASSGSGPFPWKRVLVVPNVVSDSHRQKPVATLQLLLDFVENGQPKDAVLATGYAVALEESPVAACPYAHYPIDMVDTVIDGSTMTRRDQLVDVVQGLLVKAQARSMRFDGRP